MTAKHVTAEQYALLFQPGALGVRPVQERGVEEVQGAPSQFDKITGIDDGVGQVVVFYQRFSHQLRLAGNIQIGLRRAAHQFGQGPGVIRFQMVEHDGGYFVKAAD